MPKQGTAEESLKIAMIRRQERRDELGLKTKVTLQVNDELIFEVPQEELEQVKAIVMELMPSAMSLSVPLSVELKTGDNWGDLE